MRQIQKLIKQISLFSFALSISAISTAQSTIKGKVISDTEDPIAWIDVVLQDKNKGATTNNNGEFIINNLPAGNYTLITRSSDFYNDTVNLQLKNNETLEIVVQLKAIVRELQEVVISGTMREVSKDDSPVPIEVYTNQFFKTNPTPSFFESLTQVNGVRPMVNCNVCNTGDIHINGLEGPYTMILIDGMPIVSGLGTVYGLHGIPQEMIERIEIVKGPASTLYGSEAVGGLINVITKSPETAPRFSVDAMGTSWAEFNLDAGMSTKVGEKASTMLSANYFNYSLPIDKNGDGFTDLTLQDRFSVFNKWNFQRKNNRIFTIAGRYLYEDRWGGDMRWTPEFRGGDSIYAESIYTSRWEFFGNYQLPTKENFFLKFSANGHDQDSKYGDESLDAQQYIGYLELTWNKEFKRHYLLAGTSLRYTYYDDNTGATEEEIDGILINQPQQTYLPGVFLQDEWTLSTQSTLLLGARYDYNTIHGSIFTPRVNFKWMSPSKRDILRVSAGSGYRVANIFTEDHAALTGAREVVFLNELKPETSWNGNVNYVKKMTFGKQFFLTLDASVFYTYFNNKIIPDYDTDVTKIIYDNLDGYAESKGVSISLNSRYKGFTANIGGTLMDVSNVQDGQREREEFQERYSITWTVGYDFQKIGLKFDYTGYVYGPMVLPLLSDLDPRPEISKPYSIQNIQITKSFKNGLEIYGGVKNLLNWTISKHLPFVIARTHDPFDENVVFDSNGSVVATQENPYALFFDPDYAYAPNQGINGFLGIRYNFK